MALRKSHNERQELASEMLDLHRKNTTDLARMEDIKQALREIATEDGENFKEEFAGQGVVKVSGGKPGTFLKLTEQRRETLVKAAW